MQTVATLPILQTVNDVTEHYLGLQPAIKGTTTAEYVNRNLSFNPSSNTLTLGVNLNLLPGAINTAALRDSSVTSSKIGQITRLIEGAQIITAAPSRTLNVSVLDATVYYITANAAANMTFNLIGNTTTPLDNLVQAGQAITTVFIITQGAIQYSANIAIDGVFRAANTRWLGNSRPAYVLSGGISANNLDVYSFTTIKTTGNTYTILGSNTVFGAT
jgi:hypothetical protein